MGALIGLGIGVGLMLVWAAFTMPRREKPSGGARRRSRLEHLLARAGMSNVTTTAFISLCFALGFVVFLVMLVITATPPVALVFAVMAGALPLAVVNGRAVRRQREFAEVWPEAVDNLASAVRAGLSLPQALTGLGQRGPEPLREPFTQFGLDYQVSGRFAESLDNLKDLLADPVGDRVVEGLRIAREVGGGDLGRLLRNLSSYLREELRTRSELESRQSWTVNGARVAVAAPWAVLMLLSFQRELITRFASPGGTLLLLFGAAMCILAYTVMVRIGRLPTEKRILR